MKPAILIIKPLGIFGNNQPRKEIYEEHPRTIAISFIHNFYYFKYEFENVDKLTA